MKDKKRGKRTEKHSKWKNERWFACYYLSQFIAMLKNNMIIPKKKTVVFVQE